MFLQLSKRIKRWRDFNTLVRESADHFVKFLTIEALQRFNSLKCRLLCENFNKSLLIGGGLRFNALIR